MILVELILKYMKYISCIIKEFEELCWILWKKKNPNIFEYSQERRREALFRRDESDGDGCFATCAETDCDSLRKSL